MTHTKTSPVCASRRCRLAQALDAHELERIGAFGCPKRSTAGGTEGWFDVQLSQDNAQLAFDQSKRDQTGGLAPGMIPSIIDTGKR